MYNYLGIYIKETLNKELKNMYVTINDSVWNNKALSNAFVEKCNYLCDIVNACEIAMNDLSTGIARDYESDDLVWTC